MSELELIEKASLHKFKKVNTENWDTIKDNVFIDLINSKYKETYGNPVSDNIMDLSFVYVLRENAKNSILSHMFLEEDLQKYNIDKDILRETAIKNSEKSRSKRIAPLSEIARMQSVMYPLMKKISEPSAGIAKVQSDDPSMPLPGLGTIFDIDPDTREENILAVINRNLPYGSSYAFLESTIKEISERFNGESFYILPVSRHQSWFVKDSYLKSREKDILTVENDLIDLVRQFNDDNNEKWSDILSYSIYHYFAEDGGKIMQIK